MIWLQKDGSDCNFRLNCYPHFCWRSYCYSNSWPCYPIGRLPLTASNSLCRDCNWGHRSDSGSVCYSSSIDGRPFDWWTVHRLQRSFSRWTAWSGSSHVRPAVAADLRSDFSLAEVRTSESGPHLMGRSWSSPTRVCCWPSPVSASDRRPSSLCSMNCWSALRSGSDGRSTTGVGHPWTDLCSDRFASMTTSWVEGYGFRRFSMIRMISDDFRGFHRWFHRWFQMILDDPWWFLVISDFEWFSYSWLMKREIVSRIHVSSRFRAWSSHSSGWWSTWVPNLFTLWPPIVNRISWN